MTTHFNINKKPFSKTEFFDGTVTISKKGKHEVYPFYLKVVTDVENQVMTVKKITWIDSIPSKHRELEEEIKDYYYLSL